MSHPTIAGLRANGPSLSLFGQSDGAVDPLLRFGRLPMMPVSDRELSLKAAQTLLAPPTQSRRKIWEFDTNLHCSIIGTCLTTSELRQVLGKAGYGDMAAATEHEVHSTGVRAAGKPREGAKLLHKTLDRRHRPAISRFDKAKSVDEVRGLWREAVQQGDIPGAYWAALTHPATNSVLVKEVFTEVHMLSHLVGAANRADIRRLRQLEAENAELLSKVERQQRQLRDAVVSRDATIRDLNRALESRITPAPERDASPASDEAGWEVLAGDVKQRLARSESRRESVQRQLADLRTELAAERAAKAAAEQSKSELRQELEAVEASIAVVGDGDELTGEAPPLHGLTVLYVGGRQSGIGHLKTMAERNGAVFLHHDGGLEEREGLLPGLVSRADAVVFPVDCISHAAMTLVKRLCRQADKPFLALRSTGLAPFCAALRQPALVSDQAA